MDRIVSAVRPRRWDTAVTYQRWARRIYTHRHTLTRTREREQVLRGTRKAKKRCILSIKIKNPENSVFFERKRMLKKGAAGWEGPAAEKSGVATATIRRSMMNIWVMFRGCANSYQFPLFPKISALSQEGGVCGFGIARRAQAWASPGFPREPHHVYDICHTRPPSPLFAVCFLWPARRDRTSPCGSETPRPKTREQGVQARNIVRRERVEYTCSPINREFDISDTQGCDGEGVRTYRLVVQLLPIVLGPTWRPSTLPVQTQISTTRVEFA